MEQVQPFMQTIYREGLRDDVLVALDATELALRTVERRDAAATGMAQSEHAECEQLIASCYQRLCVARQIIEAARQDAA